MGSRKISYWAESSWILLIAFLFCLATACGGSSTENNEDDPELLLANNEISLEDKIRGRRNGPPVKLDLKAIKKRGVLHAVVDNSSTSYFIYRGRRMGYEYELLKAFAEEHDIELKIIVTPNLEQAFDMLNAGVADIMAYHLTVTIDRKEMVDFTEPHTEVRQVLVQRKPQNWRDMKLHEIEREMITDPIALAGKEVVVRRGSSFANRLYNLSQEIGDEIYVNEMEGDIATEQLIRQVLEGEIQYTVADEDVAMLNESYYPDLYIETAISFPQRIAWAVRKGSPELKTAIDDWLKALKRTPDYRTIYDRYFTYTKTQRSRARSDYSSLSENGRISPYDDIIKLQAERIDWDWRLLAAQINQESKFDPKTKSWAGAEGLMQLTKVTQEEYNIDKPFNPEESIRGGVEHIKFLEDYWKDEIADETELIKFVLASYNTGQGHVRDAQRLAEKYGANPRKWDDVAEYLLKKSQPKYYQDPVVKYGYCRGVEPTNYVKDILEIYEDYAAFFKGDTLEVEASVF
ncbi:membrane-bound lytic murein transglycosylase F [Roseivirga pacifica]|uniref:Membrane-bound lytic murein transglycosylase F n=1 Tax=Roseivirga pacifica TaxID=1267423 RepID=A0A1I0NHR2_9BACT|nr:transporter substrate-binding domain-containing protein [Roseivirga pacifica]RKQ51207.1 membrane-bound lytic murein transglycosylase F [Roseivirga pacifica]SEW00963.1 membrane-bound lytic murein transglycosylase F [Roseivirga pacifica]